ENVALIGIPRLSAEDLSGWFASTTYQTRVSTPITDFARWFIAEGAAEGIRGDIAFAQAVLETGGFANNDSVNANNFSGIGHCDLCPSGWVFPSPRAGVRAQIQLLKSYAIRGPKYVYPMVDRRLRGPAGCCPTWVDLTTVWATDPTYGPKVMLIYSGIVDYALRRRAAGQGLDDAPLELAE
ncbi:MAG: glucosaminidase domain-containing protein, partial [Aquihabitans sp.]